MSENDFIKNSYCMNRRNTTISDPMPIHQINIKPPPQVPQQPLYPSISGSTIHDKIQQIINDLEEAGIEVLNPEKELLIKNYKEYVLIKEVRRKEKEELLKHVKDITDKYKKHLH
jgi:hypothetical protein